MRELVTRLVQAANNCSSNICRIDSVAHHERIVGVMVCADQDRLIVSAALIIAVINFAEWNHKNSSIVDVSAICSRLIAACGQVGDESAGGRFSRVLQVANENLRGGEVARRLGGDIMITQEQPQQAMIRMCVEWAARTMGGTGYLPRYAREQYSDFLLMLSMFSSFVDEWKLRVDFDQLMVNMGFKAIDISHLPPCPETYDAFVSYRRLDGDICARLVYQELVHREVKCFIDVESVMHGAYDLQILAALRAAKSVVFIKTENSLKGLDDPNDHVRIELDAAVAFRKDIVIVVPPRVSRTISPNTLPQTLQGLCNVRSYKLDVGENFDFSVSKIAEIVRSFSIEGN